MTKNTKAYLKWTGIYSAAVLGLILVYNICVYNFVFVPNFSRASRERTVESEIEFYAGEERYQKHLTDAQWFNEQNYPLIEITSHDGLKLKAFVLDAGKDSKGTVLLMHGFHSGPVREFATLAKYFRGLNYNVVMPYQRAHGESQGRWITFGIQERYDCRDWILKINEMYGEEKDLFVGGISMGCATITMTSGFDLPGNVKGFIADCGFTSPYEVLYWTMTKEMKLPSGVAKLFLFSINFYGKLLADFPVEGYSTYAALKVCNKPFLFITGTDDHTVPYEMTMQNFLQYKFKNPELTNVVLFEGCPHAISYLWDEEKYNSEVRKFLEKYGQK